ncbi:nitrite/sulfite reductase [Actinomadura montaniterrae]|uniref:Precorrin-3B synthase n=1 Tax=Actinomadura montaniterrae TaxID=1803903 RepID=A0A6L3VRZ0_9ACTN|nr:nitrite/sulfite reductase [Actinomadura montaniterrae]KAB2370409.1 precorrin-3B synthase [Actinomadura montaniterrae]
MSSSSRSGPDRCPGALRVHAAADGGLARVRLPGGALARAQLDALAAASRALGDGFLELTSRANLQIRGLADGAETELGERLREAGLLPSATHERVRNILGSVLTGRDGDGLLDARPVVAALDAGLCADPELAGLPGRFLFAVDDGRGDVIALRADVGLYAVVPDAFALVLAGKDSGLRARPEDAAALALDAARAFLRVRTSEWRLAELGRDLPLAGDRAEPVPVPAAPRRTPLGAIPQRDGRTAFSGLVPLGRLDPAGLGAAGEIIVTPWRGVVIPGVADMSHFPGLVTGPDWAGLTSCAGRPGCAKSLTDVRADAARARRAGGGLPVHWSGCERQCGRPADRHVAVVAVPGGYEVRLGGEVRARPHDLTATAAAAATTRRSE